MRALVLVVAVACSNERTGETAAQVQQRCESSQKLAISLVRERALFPRRLQVASERVERALRRQLRAHPELQALQDRAKSLINEATSTRATHQMCQSAFEAGTDDLAKECADADADGDRVWKAFRELATQISTSALEHADRDKLAQDVEDFTPSADDTLAKILAALDGCPRRPLGAL